MITTKAKILLNINVTASNIYKIVLFIEGMPKIKAGQFAMVDCGKTDGVLLKRPLSIHSFDNDTITILYKALGKGTKALSRMQKGSIIDIILPLGNGFEARNYSNIALVGGGLGIFPLYSVINEYPQKNYYAYLGCKDKHDFVCNDIFNEKCRKTLIATDDGSLGQKGLVTDFLASDLKRFNAIFACGPKPMLKALKNLVVGTQIPTFVSLEERMGCGFGACLTCACKTTHGTKRVCHDGPVFNITEVEL